MELPADFPSLGRGYVIHNVFHVSMLRKYRYDESHILPVAPLSGSTRLADPNWFRDARLILFI